MSLGAPSWTWRNTHQRAAVSRLPLELERVFLRGMAEPRVKVCELVAFCFELELDILSREPGANLLQKCGGVHMVPFISRSRMRGNRACCSSGSSATIFAATTTAESKSSFGGSGRRKTTKSPPSPIQKRDMN